MRTEKKIRRAIDKHKKDLDTYNKPDKNINLLPDRCPKCNGLNLYKIRVSKKLQVDLVFMKQGLRKQATLFNGGLSKCANCGTSINRNVKEIPQNGNNLNLWAVNQKIQYQQSTLQIINFLRDSFKIEVSTTQMTRSKEIMAQLYVNTYKEILNGITKSDLIHIDETIARIKGIDGYVWVFANHESVYYEFRETREPDFLYELLKEFNGVLVSDFYTGYDGLKCKQQKCLIHLIRDFNEDYLKNQFDSELKNIVLAFGHLLRSIIATIDQFGLKKFYLKKHKMDVEIFYSKVVSIPYESELALSYKKRLTKYREKIFLFLEHDNIPWNNNNAEHSIKPFAKWRKKTSTSLTKKNIENHLILLSILQTCKYRGINFFEFLKSGKLSIFEFENKRK